MLPERFKDWGFGFLRVRGQGLVTIVTTIITIITIIITIVTVMITIITIILTIITIIVIITWGLSPLPRMCSRVMLSFGKNLLGGPNSFEETSKFPGFKPQPRRTPNSVFHEHNTCA